MVLIGSRALQIVALDMGKDLYRSCVDLDYLCTEEEWKKEAHTFSKDLFVEVIERKGNKGHIKMIAGAHIEYDIAASGDSTEALIAYCEGSQDIRYTSAGHIVAPLEVLYLLKMSHRYKKNSPHFIKTMKDIHFMRGLGVTTIPEALEEIYKLRQKESYDYSHPNLNVNSKDFFKGDEVPYVYDHDTIHEAIAVLGEPAYKSYMKDGSEVMTSKEKFFAQPKHIRLLGVYEEACVLALERSQIPFGDDVDGPTPKQSFMMALSKVCTSITSGWFREYAWENFQVVVKLYEQMGQDDYVERFKANHHMVKPYEGGY